MSKIILYAVLLSLISPVLRVEAQVEDETTVKFKTILFEPRDKAAAVLFAGRIGERTEVSLNATRISDYQKAFVRDGNKVDFFESANAEKPLVTVSFLSGKDPLLFVFVPYGAEMRALAIELPQAGFGPGSTMMINVTTGIVAVKQGNRKVVTVASGKSEILSLPASFKEQMVPVQVYKRDSTEEEWEVVQSTRWPVDRRFRSYVFVYRKPEGQHLSMHGVSERL